MQQLSWQLSHFYLPCEQFHGKVNKSHEARRQIYLGIILPLKYQMLHAQDGSPLDSIKLLSLFSLTMCSSGVCEQGCPCHLRGLMSTFIERIRSGFNMFKEESDYLVSLICSYTYSLSQARNFILSDDYITSNPIIII